MLGKPPQALSARRRGWRVTLPAAAVLNALPLAALARTLSAEAEFRRAASNVRRRHGAAVRGQAQRQEEFQHRIRDLVHTLTGANGPPRWTIDHSDR